MSEPAFIQNPRRAPRAPARCRAKVICTEGVLDADTEDIGSHGAQVISPRRVNKGEPLKLAFSNDRLPDQLKLTGRVAWASAQPPYRLGVAFDAAGLADATHWFERLVAAHPDIRLVRRLPERIPLDAMLYLGAPPRFVVDFTREEGTLLRGVGSGASVGELLSRFHDERRVMERALFSLLAHQHLTLSRGASVHPEAWRRILSELEATLAIEELKPAPPQESWWRPPAAPEPARAAPEAAVGPSCTPVPTPAPLADARAALRTLEAVGGWGVRPTHLPDYRGAGVGWRAGPAPRSADAQDCLDRARAELAAGRVNWALALLRRALALAPGDAEIAGALGALAFKGRNPGR